MCLLCADQVLLKHRKKQLELFCSRTLYGLFFLSNNWFKNAIWSAVFLNSSTRERLFFGSVQSAKFSAFSARSASSNAANITRCISTNLSLYTHDAYLCGLALPCTSARLCVCYTLDSMVDSFICGDLQIRLADSVAKQCANMARYIRSKKVPEFVSDARRAQPDELVSADFEALGCYSPESPDLLAMSLPDCCSARKVYLARAHVWKQHLATYLEPRQLQLTNRRQCSLPEQSVRCSLTATQSNGVLLFRAQRCIGTTAVLQQQPAREPAERSNVHHTQKNDTNLEWRNRFYACTASSKLCIVAQNKGTICVGSRVELANVHNNKSLHSSKLSFIQFVCVLGKKKKGNIQNNNQPNNSQPIQRLTAAVHQRRDQRHSFSIPPQTVSSLTITRDRRTWLRIHLN